MNSEQIAIATKAIIEGRNDAALKMIRDDSDPALAVMWVTYSLGFMTGDHISSAARIRNLLIRTNHDNAMLAMRRILKPLDPAVAEELYNRNPDAHTD